MKVMKSAFTYVVWRRNVLLYIWSKTNYWNLNQKMYNIYALDLHAGKLHVYIAYYDLLYRCSFVNPVIISASLITIRFPLSARVCKYDKL